MDNSLAVNTLLIILTGILLIATVADLRFQKIPNLLTFPSILVAIIYHGILNGIEGVMFSAGGLAVGIAIFILPYVMGGMGAGDAKLMGVVGAFLGVRGVVVATLYTAVAGGIYAIVLLIIYRKTAKKLISRIANTFKLFALTKQFDLISADEDEKKPKLCYGVAIATGTIFFMVSEFYGYHFPMF